MTQKINKSLKIAKELNKFGNQLTTIISELLIESDAYNDHYYDQIYSPKDILNDKDGNQTRRELKKLETHFDRIYETLMRNESIIQFQETVEKILIEFQQKLNEFKAEIALDNNKFVAANNEILRSMTYLERNVIRKSIKSIENKEENEGNEQINERKFG